MKTLNLSKILRWLKMFTYIAATVLLIVNNTLDKLTFLIPVVVLLVLVNYFREYYLEINKKPLGYIIASMGVESVLIIILGYIDTTEICLLFLYVLLSSTVIIYSILNALPMAALYIVSRLIDIAVTKGVPDMLKSIVPVLFSYGVPVAFVIGMSYLVKVQVEEKEKLAHMNTELELAYKRLIESSAATQKLAVEEERTRMAREIHDTLAHTLTTLIIQLEACKKLSVMDTSRLPAELEKAQELSRSGFNDVKRSIKALRPQVMEEKSFFASIHTSINEIMETTKVNIIFDNMLPPETQLESQVEISLFRAIQECITNSIRHGKAGKIEINLKQVDKHLQLMISDNGIGCANFKKGFGMKGLLERVEKLKGKVNYSSAEGKGFQTTISIPEEV